MYHIVVSSRFHDRRSGETRCGLPHRNQRIFFDIQASRRLMLARKEDGDIDVASTTKLL